MSKFKLIPISAFVLAACMQHNLAISHGQEVVPESSSSSQFEGEALSSSLIQDNQTTAGLNQLTNAEQESTEEIMTTEEAMNDMSIMPVASFVSTPRQNTNQIYTVQAGDYLYKIANQYGVTVDQLKTWNNLSSNYIYTGNKLIVTKPKTVPETTETVTNNPKTTATNNPVNTEVAPATVTKTYTVKSGDYLYKIATQYGITVNQLKAWNNLSSNYIYAGNKLIVTDPNKVKWTNESTATNQKPKPVEKDTNKSTDPITTYTIKPGDYLNKIANQYGITVNQLKTWNKLNSDYIYAGDKLIVSNPNKVTLTTEKPTKTETDKPSQKPETKTEKDTKTSPIVTTTYTIKPGDYLYKIANQYGVTIEQLKVWNHLSSNYIYAGNKLIVSDPNKANIQIEKPTKTEDIKTEQKPTNPTREEKVTNTPVTVAKTYTIKPGDYLYKIANQYGITIDQLKTWNNLTSNYIYAGNTLIVSNPNNISQTTTPKPTVSPTTPKETLTNNSDKYTGTIVSRVNYGVEKGETLTSIAKKFGVSIDAIKQVNGYISSVQDGQTLVIPNVRVKPMDLERSADNKRTVWLDAGHGGNDSGTQTVAGVLYEKTMNLNIDNKLTKVLENMGYIVRRTRTDDTAVDFRTERSRRVNASDADIFISLHHNAMPTPSAIGIESFYYEYDPDYQPVINKEYHNDASRVTNSAHLTTLIHNNLLAADRAYYPNNPSPRTTVKSDTYAVLRETKVPAALLEFGFVDTWNDYNKLTNPGYQDTLVRAVARGIDTYFNTVFSKK